MSNSLRFFRSTAGWALALTGIEAIYQVALGFGSGGGWSPGLLTYQVPRWFGIFLPFAAFAGGLALSRVSSLRRTMLFGLVITALTYGILAYADPILTYQTHISENPEATARYPFGARTHSGMRALRAHNEENPPWTSRPSTDRPLDLHPNWLTWLILSPLVISGFAILAALLGRQVGILTGGLSPPARRNARWSLGLFSALAFFIALHAGRQWIFADPHEHSPYLAVWLPMLVPLVEMAVLVILTQRSRPLHASDPSGV